MKVTTSCSGRFHIFDQAAQLERHGVLHRFISNYPKLITRRWGIPNTKVANLILLPNGVAGRVANRFASGMAPDLKSDVFESLHGWFSKWSAWQLPLDTDIFIGLSSFCLEGLTKANARDIISIVDHGSLHQRTERSLMEEESRFLGLEPDTNLAPEWIIEKEDKEFKIAKYVMVLSEAARHSLIEQNIPAEKIFVNPCGVDLSQFSTQQKKRDSVFRIVFCGAMTPRKGIHYLLQAFSELRLKDAELWIIGGAYDSEFEKLLEKYKAPNVRFIGTVAQKELADLYNQSSVFILPSVADGFGMVVPQAMACGLPVIVTDHVGAADIVTNNVDGFVIPIRDVAAIKERILTLYQQPEVMGSMSRAALTKSARLSWDAYGDRLVKFLTDVSNKKVK